MKIVHEIEPGVFVRWPSGHPLMVTCRTETVVVNRTGIGKVDQFNRDCEPYEIEERAPTSIGAAFWKNHTDEELADRKLYRVQPFAIPDGKQKVGVATYRRVNGKIVEEYDVEDIPPPAPDPTPEEKLANAGLSEAEFDDLISKSLARQTGKKGSATVR